MQPARFDFSLARRFSFHGHRSISTLVIRLAVISVIIAVAVMEVVVSIVNGFESEIQRKVMGFGSHIQIGATLKELDSKVDPVPRNGNFVRMVRAVGGVKTVSPVVEVPCMIKSKTTQEGILMKGVEPGYDWTFYEQSLKEGRLPDFNGPEESKEILISRKLCDLLNLQAGKSCFLYFFKDQKGQDSLSMGELVDIRKVKIAGIFETGMEEFDKVRVMCDIRLLQQVSGLPADKVSGFEVNLEDPSQLEPLTKEVSFQLPPTLQAYPINKVYPEIFEWLNLQHQNVWFILILLVIIAVINMTGVVLILILERTQTIGLLKAVGMPNARVMRVFIFNAFFLILIGVVLGNLLGLGLIASQDLWGWLEVDQANYFVKVVPVSWAWFSFLLVNVGVVIVCTLSMILPVAVVSRILPSRSLRFQ